MQSCIYNTRISKGTRSKELLLINCKADWSVQTQTENFSLFRVS